MQQEGMHVCVYRHGTIENDCSNGGVSGRFDTLTLIGEGVPKLFPATDKEPALYLRQFQGNLVAVPSLDDGRWFQFGGNFVYSSDSRFAALTGGAPIPVHDRLEDGFVSRPPGQRIKPFALMDGKGPTGYSATAYKSEPADDFQEVFVDILDRDGKSVAYVCVRSHCVTREPIVHCTAGGIEGAAGDYAFTILPLREAHEAIEAQE